MVDRHDPSQAIPDTTPTPAWTLEYVAAALACGQQVQEIEARLVVKGLSRSEAANAVDLCLARQAAALDRNARRSKGSVWLQRGASFAIACFFVLVAVSHSGLSGALRTSAALLLPLACIWYPEAMGSYAGAVYYSSLGRIDRPTPALFVMLGGWLLLVGVPLLLLVLVG